MVAISIQTQEQIAEQGKLAVDLPLINERLFRAGLFKTGHACHEAVKAMGWEMAEQIERRAKDAA